MTRKITYFLYLSSFEKKREYKYNSEKMSKFKKNCNNPLHENWSKSDEGKVVNLQARGLLKVANALQLYVEELGKKSSP